ncbi:MAG: YceI family protein [Bryobacteraceae bacterium]
MRRIPIALLALASLALAETYQIQPAPDSRFALSVEKTGLYRGKKHLFLFEKYQGSLQFDSAKPAESKIQLTIDAGSVVCKDDWVSASDLKKVMQTTLEDMLAVKRYPTMTFSSTSIRDLGTGKYEAQGTLTIRDIPKPAVVTVQLNATNPSQLKVDGSAIIKLSDYKLKPPSAILGVIGTKNEMTLTFSISASKLN